MSKIDYETILDYRRRTWLWNEFCYMADVFDPSENHEISVIIPNPDRREVLIFSDKGLFMNEQSALTTLHQYSFAHCFPDYTTLSSVLKDIGYFGKYKFPWACPYFALFPLEGGRNSIWINPLKIENIYPRNNLHYAQMTHGLKLFIPAQRYYTLLHAEIACGILAAIRQDSFRFSMLGNRPMNYLSLPNTAFVRSLIKRPLLEKFVTRPGEVYRRYQRARFLHYYHQLEADPETLHWENWQ